MLLFSESTRGHPCSGGGWAVCHLIDPSGQDGCHRMVDSCATPRNSDLNRCFGTSPDPSLAGGESAIAPIGGSLVGGGALESGAGFQAGQVGLQVGMAFVDDPEHAR